MMRTPFPSIRPSRRILISILLGTLASQSFAQSVQTARIAPENDVTFESYVTAYGGSSAAFFNGTYINQLIGATTFYAAGYTGTRATVANIEGGYIGKNTLTTAKTSAYFAGNGALAYSNASAQDHATMVGSMIAGYSAMYNADPTYGNSLRGIAYGAKLWSGNIASGFLGGGSFNAPINAIWGAYNQAMSIGATSAGANVGTAGIINSSWGFSSTNAATMAGISAGFDVRTIAVDSLIAKTHKLLVISAGNNALNANGNPAAAPLNHVAGIGAGYNSLTVGSLGGNVVGNPGASYLSRSSFSSYGPNNYYDPKTGTIINNVRAAVDIAAPGEQIVGEVKAGGSFTAADGTSFSSPIVAGVAGLLTDVSIDRGYTNATDSRVLAAILMNSADKNAGWTNNASSVNGVYGTTQGLDWQTGAGKLNADQAFKQLTSGTTDLAGLAGGNVQATGWDFGGVSDRATTDYILGGLKAGSTFSAMLRWDAGSSTVSTDTTLSSASYDFLSDLRLELWSSTGTLLAFSDSAYNNTEHIYFTVPTTTSYVMRVRWMGENYDFINHANAETYGLAWSGVHAQAVPEPASLAALGLGILAVTRRRRKSS